MNYSVDAREILIDRLSTVQGGMCAACGKRISGRSGLRYFVPLEDGGLPVEANVQLIHIQCGGVTARNRRRDEARRLQGDGRGPIWIAGELKVSLRTVFRYLQKDR